MSPSSQLEVATKTASPQRKAIGRSLLRLRPAAVRATTPVAVEAPHVHASHVQVDFARHRDEVVRYLTWLRIPKPAVDELTQDVFLVAHRRREEFRGDSSIKTWLSGIAFHLVLNWRRRRKWRQHWEQGDAATSALSEPESIATSRTAMDELLTKELCSRVASVLNEQPDFARSLWLMVVLEETPLSRAAKLLGLTEYQAQQAFTKTQQRVQQSVLREEGPRVGGPKRPTSAAR
jgi:RNA polymerase sigma-70 factor, ECF subfamily